MGHTVATLHDRYTHHMAQFAEDAEIDPVALILEARGQSAPKAPPIDPNDELVRRLASLSEDQRARLLAAVDEAQWDEATSGERSGIVA